VHFFFVLGQFVTAAAKKNDLVNPNLPWLKDQSFHILPKFFFLTIKKKSE
jgi:hypothetical protein